QSNIPHAIWGSLLRKDQNAKELVIENFMLVKGWPLAQTVSHMKTPSGTFTLAALAAIAIGAILTFRLLAQSPSPSPTPAEPTYSLVIGTKTSPGAALPVTDPGAFKNLLASGEIKSDV